MDWPAPDPTSPYFCHGPTLISFSGGRTSAYMLYMVLCAHGGMLPDYVFVVFCNTGKEREETLFFVYQCGLRWNVHIWWLEWVDRPSNDVRPEDRFIIVGLNSANRDGTPLRALFRRKRYLPNAVTRFCTAEAKIDTMKQFMLSRGFSRWHNMVGLRLDERKRLMKQVLRNLSGKEVWTSTCPLAMAGVMKRHIKRFWLGRNATGTDRRYPLPQGFDLGLDDHDGNCDACFLKGFMVLAHIERTRPGTLDWWIEAEDEVTAMISAGEIEPCSGARFITEHTYRQIQQYARSAAVLPHIDEIEFDADCGVSCAVDDGDEEVDDGALAWLLEQLRKAAAEPVPMPIARPILPPAVGDLFQ